MPGLLDELSPSYVGAQAIRLTPADLSRPIAFNAVDIVVDLHPSGPPQSRTSGLSLPLELTVTSPSPSGFYRHVFRTAIPKRITFTPREGGQHLVRIREVGHNHWWGALVVSVAGEQADPRSAT